MNYDSIQKLNELRNANAITEEEFQAEKKKILNNEAPSAGAYWGMHEKQFCLLLHLSQLLNFLIPFSGLILQLVMWSTFKDNNTFITTNGKAAINWMISCVIYSIILVPLCLIVIGIPLMIILGVVNIIFCIMAGLKASEGQVWEYPMSIKILK